MDNSDITFGDNESTFGVWCQGRRGSVVATLKEIDYDEDANAIILSNAEERKVGLVLCRDQVTA